MKGSGVGVKLVGGWLKGAGVGRCWGHVGAWVKGAGVE